MMFYELTRSGSAFQWVGTVTEKARVPAWVLSVRSDRWEPDKRSTLDLSDTESMENKYGASPSERVW